MMIPVLLAALLQDVQVDVKQKSPEVRLSLSGPAGSGPAILTVRRRVVTVHDGILGEGWADEQVESAETEKGRLKGELELDRPGLYDIALGSSGARVIVSRADFAGWRAQIDALRASAKRLAEVAAAIDQAGTPSLRQAGQLRKQLQQERDRLTKAKSDFTGSLRALQEGVDRLFFFRSMIKVPNVPEGETVPGYEDPKPRAKDDPGPMAREEVRGLLDVIAREGALIIVDELRFFLETDVAAERVVRWKSRDAALIALQQALEGIGGFPGIAELIRQMQQNAEPAAMLARSQELRADLFKPPPPPAPK
jgi:hypothetical protein